MDRLTNHNDLTGLTAAVLGAGASGLAAARLLAARGARVRLLDKNPGAVGEALAAELAGRGIAARLGEHAPEDFAGVGLVVISPGIPAAKLAGLLPVGVELISELELASRYVVEPILAITGTNGKTTTTMLAAAILEAAGKKVFTGGNIGTPLSEYVLGGEKADVLMDENQVKVQFKDKKAMVKWTEEDLTVQMGDDDKSKIHMTEDVVHLSQGANAHIEMKEDGILYKVGGTSMYLADDGLTVTAGGTFWKFSGSGLHQTGGDIGHNKKSIGFMHIHGATPPPSLPFQGDEGSPHSGGPTDAGGGPGTGVGTA